MIHVKRFNEPKQNIKFKNERERLESYINHFKEISGKNKKNDIKVTRRFYPKNISSLDLNWHKTIHVQFNNKCAYCESVINNEGEIDHFRPVSGVKDLNNETYGIYYVWLAYEWTNLYLCCDSCNTYKANHFPVKGDRVGIFEDVKYEEPLIIDPCIDMPQEHFFFDPNGTMYSKSEKGEETIKILNLNRTDLIRERMNKYFSIKQLLNNSIKLGIDGLYNAFSIILKPTLPYQAVAIQCMAEWIEYDINDSIRIKILQDRNCNKIIKQIFGDFENQQDLMQRLQGYFDNGTERTKIDKLSYTENRIMEIEINDIRGITLKHSFDLSNNRGSWLMLLGENGTGKTTILQAIAMALIGDWKGLRINQKSFINTQTNSSIKIKIEGEEEPRLLFFNDENNQDRYNVREINIIAYGAVRLIPEKSSRNLRFENKNVNVRNLFARSSNAYFLENFNAWIADEKIVKAVSLVILDILPFGDEDEVDIVVEEGKAYLMINKRKLEFYELSSGYQSIIAIAIDIMRSVYNTYGSGHLAEGIVLIDEIDSHLHPSWKIRIVSQFRKAFPNMQFIVTSHDPLCLRGMNDGEIAVLKRVGNEISVYSDLPDPKGLRIDQILTSELFGLESTIEAKTDDLIKRYYELINIDEKDADTELELENIEQELDSPEIKYLGYTNRERLMYEVIDKDIANRKKNNRPFHVLDDETQDKILKIWGLNDEGDIDD